MIQFVPPAVLNLIAKLLPSSAAAAIKAPQADIGMPADIWMLANGVSLLAFAITLAVVGHRVMKRHRRLKALRAAPKQVWRIH